MTFAQILLIGVTIICSLSMLGGIIRLAVMSEEDLEEELKKWGLENVL